MKVKVKDVIIGAYEYDSIVVDIDGKTTEIVFDKKENLSQYMGKDVDLVYEKGVFKIKPFIANKKND